MDLIAPHPPQTPKHVLARLISWDYLCQQRELHGREEFYGAKGYKWAGPVLALITEIGATSVLDYGCGSGTLARKLRAQHLPWLRIAEYDPAIPGKDGYPSFADLVTCTDVLEHVERDRLPFVLTHLQGLARKALFAVIALRPSEKTLRDGRNAHLIVEPTAWWLAQLEQAGFDVVQGPVKTGKVARELSVVATVRSEASV